MVDLPELNDSQIGFIQYWDFLSHGASTIEPTEALSYDSINTYEQFDNGVQGTLEHNFARGGSREFNWRVVNNGWILTWMGRENSFNTDVTDRSNLNGYWDLIDDWTSNTPQTFPVTTLSNQINNLRQELPNSSDSEFNYTEVGIHNFDYDNASRYEILSEHDSYTSHLNGGFGYVESADVVYHATVGMVKGTSSEVASVSFESNTLAGITNGNSTAFGAIDSLNDGIIPDSGTVYRNGSTRNDSTGTGGPQYVVCHLSIQE